MGHCPLGHERIGAGAVGHCPFWQPPDGALYFMAGADERGADERRRKNPMRADERRADNRDNNPGRDRQNNPASTGVATIPPIINANNILRTMPNFFPGRN